MRRVRYQVASSLDGFIAGPDDDFDWITPEPAFDFEERYAQFDTLLIGRRTYEALWLAMVYLAVSACASGFGERSDPAAPPRTVVALQSADSALVQVAGAAARIGNQMARAWPGFWSKDHAFMVYRPGEAALLVSTSAAPEGFLAIPDPLVPAALRGRAYLYRGSLPGLEGVFRIDFPVGATTVTAVAVDPEGITATLETLFHEAFHGYQGRRFARTASPIGEYIDPADVAQPEFRALAEMERRMLLAALDMERASLADHLRQYLAVRWTRTRMVPADVHAVERYLERSEGSAHLVGLEAGRLAEGEPRDGLTDALRPYLAFPLDTVSGGHSERLIRWRVYGTGAAIGVLLDRMGVQWRPRMEDGAHFDDLLAMAIRFDSAAAPVLAELALDRFGFTDLLASAIRQPLAIEARPLEDFLARAPVRLLVELRVPIEDGIPMMEANFSAGTAGFSQIEPNLMALPGPEVVTIQVPAASLVVNDRPVLWDLRAVAAGRMRITILLPRIPAVVGHHQLSRGEHQLERFEVDSDGVRIMVDERVSVEVTKDAMIVRPSALDP